MPQYFVFIEHRQVQPAGTEYLEFHNLRHSIYTVADNL